LIAVVAGWALAVDGESNIVVTYPGGIVKISASGATTTIPGTGGWGAAVDDHDNLFYDGRLRQRSTVFPGWKP
jgi:hypothetical protein